MTAPIVHEASNTRPAHIVAEGGWAAWHDAAPEGWRRWLAATGFKPKPQATALLPGPDGDVAAALLVTARRAEPWDAAALWAALPAGAWRLEDPDRVLAVSEAAYGAALAAYRFQRYRKEEAEPARLLVLPRLPHVTRALAVAAAVNAARDLVNTGANDLGPAELQVAAEEVATRHGATVRTVIGDELAQGYPLVHAVGAASGRPPRLVDVRWGEADAPRVTLVGKGVVFDTGGLDIKPASGMLLMKKDKGGAAMMLGLAGAVMGAGLPVRLRLLLPIVENAISGTAFRPGDVVRSRKGVSVEIGNTDAEGRLILADALTEAVAETPAVLLDAATLTGAARVALGPELPALFANDDGLADAILAAGRDVAEPLWRMPLHAPYRSLLKSPVADINNVGAKPFAGAITAAVFLQEFVPASVPWAHLDIFGWNDEARPGRPRGGEATALRPLLTMLERRFASA